MTPPTTKPKPKIGETRPAAGEGAAAKQGAEEKAVIKSSTKQQHRDMGRGIKGPGGGGCVREESAVPSVVSRRGFYLFWGVEVKGEWGGGTKERKEKNRWQVNPCFALLCFALFRSSVRAQKKQYQDGIIIIIITMYIHNLTQTPSHLKLQRGGRGGGVRQGRQRRGGQCFLLLLLLTMPPPPTPTTTPVRRQNRGG